MKRYLIFGLMAVLLAACGEGKPPYTDNGHPGQIKAIAFYDDNKNGVMDNGETSGQFIIGISQDVSCPPSSLDKNTFSNTDANGTALIGNLKPGKYCVGLKGNYSMTTGVTQQVYVSSDMITTVAFGVVRDQ